MIKRLLALTLALLLVLAAFAACKPNKEAESEAVVTEPPTAEPAETIALDFNPATTKVALLIGNQSLPANRYAAHGFLRTAENLGYPAILYAADDSQAAAARVDEAITAGVKGMLVWADGDAMNAAIDKASAAGIKIVVPYYRAQNGNVSTNLYVDYADISMEALRVIMGEVAARNYQAGKVVFVRASTGGSDADKAVYDALASHLRDKYAQFSVADWSMGATKEESIAAAAAYLKENGDVASVICFVPGAADVWMKAKAQVEKELKPKTTPKPTPKPTPTPKPSGSPEPTPVPTPKPLDPNKRNICVVAVGYSEENVGLVKAGTIYGLLALPYFDSTAQSMMMLDRLLRNIAAPQEAKLNAPVIRKNGIAKYESIVNEVKSWFAESQTSGAAQ